MSDEASAERPVLFTHDGHDVRLTRSYEFEVSGPAFDGEYDKRFDTAQKAREAIDRRAKALERQERTKATMAIEAIDDMGEPCTIRGIHMNSRRLLGVPQVDHRSTPRRVLPPARWLRNEVRRWRALKKECADLENKIAGYWHLGSATGHGRIEAVDYDAAVKRFQEEWAALVAKAERDAPKGDLPER